MPPGGRPGPYGDMRDHGTPEHSGDWWTTGYTKSNTSACDTYTASADKVS